MNRNLTHMKARTPITQKAGQSTPLLMMAKKSGKMKQAGKRRYHKESAKQDGQGKGK